MPRPPLRCLSSSSVRSHFRMASSVLSRVYSRLARVSTRRAFVRSHSNQSPSALLRPRRRRSYLIVFPICLVLSASASASTCFTQSLSSPQVETPSVIEAATGVSFPLSIRPPSHRAAAIDTAATSAAAGADLQLVSVGNIRLSSDTSAAIALYRSSPHSPHARHSETVIAVQLTAATTGRQVQETVRRVLSPAVEAATGTEWDDITSCSQLDTALAGLYVPPAPRSSLPSPPPPSSTPPTLPAGTLLLVELTGRLLHVWLNSRLVCSLDSRMLNAAVVASLSPLCSQQHRQPSER